jgi:FMN phosphatase YigB (HAD superfamily)
LEEAVFLDLYDNRIEWKDQKLISSPKPNDTTTNLEIGIIYDKYTMKLEFKSIKVIFFDLGETLVTWDRTKSKFVSFIQTYDIVKDLERRKIEIGIISDGSRTDLDNLIEDQNLLSKFKVVVMSEDDDVQASKPDPKIFNMALSKMSSQLEMQIKASDTAFISEDIHHFRKYNFEFSR